MVHIYCVMCPQKDVFTEILVEKQMRNEEKTGETKATIASCTKLTTVCGLYHTCCYGACCERD